MTKIGSFLFLSAIFLSCSDSFCEFQSDFLGNFVSDDEYSNRTLCWTKLCLKDSGRLIYDADHNSNKTSPCDDFKTFAMGEFFEHRVPNDRYQFLGFMSDVQLQYYEKQKRMLLKPVKQDDPKMFKVIKTFFRLCINSSHVKNQAPKDVIAYAQRIGILKVSSDDGTKLVNIRNAMAVLSVYSIRIFFDHTLKYCTEDLREKLCLELESFGVSHATDNGIFDVLEKLESLKIDHKEQMAKDLLSYLEMKKLSQDQYKSYANETETVTIKELNERYKSKHLDWLQMINEHLMGDSQQTLDSEILIRNPRLLEALHKLFVNQNETFIANAFATAFLTKKSKYFTAYLHTKAEELEYGKKRTSQRFEQCLDSIKTIMNPALEALLAVNFYDKSVQKAATELVEVAVADLIEEFSKNEQIVNKLKSVKLLVMFPDDILNLTKIGELYKEIEFEDTESLIEVNMKIDINDLRLQVRPRNDWLSIMLPILGRYTIFYSFERNIVYVPAIWTLYPFFHPERPRFFNMATLYKSVVTYIIIGLNHALPNEDFEAFDLDFEEMADKSYVKWETNGGVDLQLPSFKLTNRQMLWLCLAHRSASVFQKLSVKDTTIRYHRILNKYFHISLKANRGFREAFQCGDLTSAEIKELIEFRRQKNEY